METSTLSGSLQPTLMEGFQPWGFDSTLVYLLPEGMFKQFTFSLFMCLLLVLFIITTASRINKEQGIRIQSFMGKYFWFYLVLQALVLLLIAQAAFKNHRLGLSRRGSESGRHVVPTPDTRYVTRECVAKRTLEDMRDLQRQMQIGIWGRGYGDSGLGKEEIARGERRITEEVPLGGESKTRVVTETMRTQSYDSNTGRNQTETKRETTRIKYDLQSN